MAVAATCSTAGDVELPQTPGVVYTAEPLADDLVKVVATALPGYEIVGDAEWTLEVGPQLSGEVCEDPVDPTGPTDPVDPTEPTEPANVMTPPTGVSSFTVINAAQTPVPANTAPKTVLPNTGLDADLLAMLAGGVLLLLAGGLLRGRARRTA